MSILINKNSRVLIQGITGNEGMFHAWQMFHYGTNIVAGVTPGKGGEWMFEGKIPIFDSVKIAKEATEANVSVIFVPAHFAVDAVLEASNAGIELVVCVTEGAPIKDMMKVRSYLDQKGTKLIGPNSPGLITPVEANVGVFPGNITIPGNIGVISRSGTLTYEVLYAMTLMGIGTSTCVGIGGDVIRGLGFIELLEMFEMDPLTDQIVLIGEIGGNEEEKAAEYISRFMTKPIIAYIAGLSAPIGKRMGHAGAIIEGGCGTAEEKIKALHEAGVQIAKHPEEVAKIINR